MRVIWKFGAFIDVFFSVVVFKYLTLIFLGFRRKAK